MEKELEKLAYESEVKVMNALDSKLRWLVLSLLTVSSWIIVTTASMAFPELRFVGVLNGMLFLMIVGIALPKYDGIISSEMRFLDGISAGLEGVYSIIKKEEEKNATKISTESNKSKAERSPVLSKPRRAARRDRVSDAV